MKEAFKSAGLAIAVLLGSILIDFAESAKVSRIPIVLPQLLFRVYEPRNYSATGR